MLAPEASISAHLYADKTLDMLKAQVRASSKNPVQFIPPTAEGGCGLVDSADGWRGSQRGQAKINGFALNLFEEQLSYLHFFWRLVEQSRKYRKEL